MNQVKQSEWLKGLKKLEHAWCAINNIDRNGDQSDYTALSMLDSLRRAVVYELRPYNVPKRYR